MGQHNRMLPLPLHLNLNGQFKRKVNIFFSWRKNVHTTNRLLVTKKKSTRLFFQKLFEMMENNLILFLAIKKRSEKQLLYLCLYGKYWARVCKWWGCGRKYRKETLKFHASMKSPHPIFLQGR